MELTPIVILTIIGGTAFGWLLSSLKSTFKVSELKKELEKKEFTHKEHFNSTLKINSENTIKLEQEIKNLKERNDNLSISVKTLGQNKGNAEIRVLHIYDNAIRKMTIQAPGFSTTWELALQEAELEYEDAEKGFKSIVNKVFKRQNSSQYSNSTSKLLGNDK